VDAFRRPQFLDSATPRRASARIALHTSAVPHQRKIPTLAAGFAFVAFGAGFGAFFGGGRLGVDARVGPGEMLERLRGREFLLRLGLQCCGAIDVGAGVCSAERRDVGGAAAGSASGAAFATHVRLGAALHHFEPVGARARQTF
jgi:hypothetical protein